MLWIQNVFLFWQFKGIVGLINRCVLFPCYHSLVLSIQQNVLCRSVPVSSILLCHDNHICVFLLLPDANERLANRFSVDGIFNYTLLLLSQEDDMLYVGAREALFALSLSDISKTKLQKNVCLIPCVWNVELISLPASSWVIFQPQDWWCWPSY